MALSLQPDTVRSSMHGICLRLTCFSLEKWPSCFRDTAPSLWWIGQGISLNNLWFRGWTAGGQEGGREAPLLTAGLLPPQLAELQPNKGSVRRARRCLGREQKSPFPAGLSTARGFTQSLGNSTGDPSSHWASLLATRETPWHTGCMHYIHIRSSNLSHSALDDSLHCFPISGLGQRVCF